MVGKERKKRRGQRSNRNFLACFSESRVMTAVERKKANDLHVNVEKVVKREKSGSFDAAAAATQQSIKIEPRLIRCRKCVFLAT